METSRLQTITAGWETTDSPSQGHLEDFFSSEQEIRHLTNSAGGEQRRNKESFHRGNQWENWAQRVQTGQDGRAETSGRMEPERLGHLTALTPLPRLLPNRWVSCEPDHKAECCGDPPESQQGAAGWCSGDSTCFHPSISRA